MKSTLAGLAALAFTALLPTPSAAQGYDPAFASGRLAALGGAGVAFGSDDGFTFIVNPAHLGDAEGFSWGRYRATTPFVRAVKNSATGALGYVSSSNESRVDFVTLGIAGIGVSLSGRPIHALGGSTYAADAPSTPNDRNLYFPPGEVPTSGAATRNFGLGIRGFHTLRYLSTLVGRPLPRWDDYADISLGWLWQKTALRDTVEADSDEVGTRAWGALLRVSPYHHVMGEIKDGALVEEGPLEGLGGIAVDITAGVSSAPVGVGPAGRTRDPVNPKQTLDPSFRLKRRGVAARVATGMARFLRPDESGELTPWARVLGPTFDFQASVERDRVEMENGPGSASDSVNALAMELTTFGVLSLRLGNSGAHRVHYGFGLRAHYGDAVSVRYDRAWVPTPRTGDVPLPQSRFEDIPRYSWSFNVNPYGVMKTLLGE